MRRIKFAILAVILLVGGIVLGSLWVNLQSKRASEDEKAPTQFSTDDAKMFLEKVHFVEDKQGRKTWELEAKSVQQNREENLMTVEDVKVTVYGDGGRPLHDFREGGRVHLDSKDMELVGDVTVTSSEGYRLKNPLRVIPPPGEEGRDHRPGGDRGRPDRPERKRHARRYRS